MKTLNYLGYKSTRKKKSFWLNGVLTSYIFLSILVLVSCFYTPSALAAEKPTKEQLQFTQGENGSFNFNTGILKGVLRLEGKSSGLDPVTYVPDSLRISAGEGLYNHYRVFTKGKRFGYGARRWPSTAQLLSDGSVEVIWTETTDRPFELRAIYRIISPNSIDVLTIVKAKTKLEVFEVFLASYLDSMFTNSLVYTTIEKGDSQKKGFVSADRELGEWLAFPRDKKATKVINDGRWELEPSPIEWTMMPNYQLPLAVRKDSNTGLTVIMMTKRDDCFGIFSPYGEEKHYSTYMSLFGNNIKAGETASSHSRLVVTKNSSEEEILEIADSFRKFNP